jgi:SAM-dependent methyltransferase
VANPWTEYHEIYSDAYYCGEGADPLVDYAIDLACPSTTIHMYEWRGIFRAVKNLVSVDNSTQWLDFGSGAGGLVRYLRAHNVEALGFEESAIAKRARAVGIPVLNSSQLVERNGTFDIVTAIEVLEHVHHPLEVLAQIRRLLKPGGLFFYTTGNARPYRDRLVKWRYVVPEVHVSFYEPETLVLAMQKTGFRPQNVGYLPGFTDILHYRILKTLRFKHRSLWEAPLPWSLLSRSAQVAYKFFAHPIGWAD